MHLYSVLAAALLSANISLAAVVTQIDYVTQYSYEDVNVLVDDKGVPYSTVTSTISTGAAPGASQATAVTSVESAASPASPASSVSTTVQAAAVAPSSSTPAVPTAAAAAAVSHSHVEAPNYNYVTPTESSEGTPSTAPAPASTSSSLTTSSWVPPAPTTSSTPAPTPATTSSTTSTAAPATTSAASGGSFSGDATYYDVGLGACGVTNTDSELIAALNVEQFNQFGSMSNGNPACGKQATLHYQGKSVTVTIQDKCMGCKYGDLDLSPAAFQALADESVGRFPMTWSFN